MSMDKVIRISYYQKLNEKVSKPYVSVFYLLKGDCVLKLNGNEYSLSSGAVCIVNAFELYDIQLIDGILAIFTIDNELVETSQDTNYHFFKCNSVLRDGEIEQSIRSYLKKMIDASYTKQFNLLLYNKYCFDFILYIQTHCMDNVVVNDNNRIYEIERYIFKNYANDLSLDMIADHFGLSSPYFSKLFKSNFGIPFIKYLNNLRVELSLDDLVSSRNKTVLKIAFDHGFANLTSYNSCFKAIYGINPSQYRKSHSEDLNQQITPGNELADLFDDDNSQMIKDIELVEMKISQNLATINPLWSRILNVGKMSRLYADGVLEQIRNFNTAIGFSYARISLDGYDPKVKENDFYREDLIVDALFDSKLKLFLSIDFRIYERNEGYRDYLKNFLYHITNRYGLKNVCDWNFEVVYNSDFTNDKSLSYSMLCSYINSVLADIGFSHRVCGPALQVDHCGDNLRRFLEHNNTIEMLTLDIRPYTMENDSGTIFVNRNYASNYIGETLKMVKEVLDSLGLNIPFKVVSWSDTLLVTNMLNDTSYRAARLLEVFFAEYGVLDSLPIDLPLDSMNENVVNNKYFNGLSGLITANGIKKNSYYSFLFMKKMDDFFLYKNEHMFATCSDGKYIQLVCHNCKKLSYKFYMDEEDLSPESIDDYFEDLDKKQFKFVIHNIPNGLYVIKERHVDDQRSAFKEWKKIKYEDSSFFGFDEKKYLSSIAIPKIGGYCVKVTSNILTLNCTLEANAIHHIHVIPKR